MEVAVTGSEVEGFYGLLRAAVSHSSLPTSSPPPKKTHHAPPSTISHPPPQESKEPEASVPAKQALESTSSTAPSVLEREIPANMQPLHIQLGGIKRVYRCQVEGCREGPSTSHATICTHMCRVHLGVGLVCPLCNKSFFNPWHIQASQEESHKPVNGGVAHEGFVNKSWVGGSVTFNCNNLCHLYYISFHSHLVVRFHIPMLIC